MKKENNIKKIRTEKGISVCELSRKIELSERYVRFLENGDKTPSLETASKIAKALDKNIEEIFVS